LLGPSADHDERAIATLENNTASRETEASTFASVTAIDESDGPLVHRRDLDPKIRLFTNPRWQLSSPRQAIVVEQAAEEVVTQHNSNPERNTFPRLSLLSLSPSSKYVGHCSPENVHTTAGVSSPDLLRRANSSTGKNRSSGPANPNEIERMIDDAYNRNSPKKPRGLRQNQRTIASPPKSGWPRRRRFQRTSKCSSREVDGAGFQRVSKSGSEEALDAGTEERVTRAGIRRRREAKERREANKKG